MLPPEALGENAAPCFWWLPALLGLWPHHSSFQGSMCKWLSSPTSRHLLFRVSGHQISLCLSLIKLLTVVLRAHMDHLGNVCISRSLMTSAKSPFPNKLAFFRFQGLGSGIFWGVWGVSFNFLYSKPSVNIHCDCLVNANRHEPKGLYIQERVYGWVRT